MSDKSLLDLKTRIKFNVKMFMLMIEEQDVFKISFCFECCLSLSHTVKSFIPTHNLY